MVDPLITKRFLDVETSARIAADAAETSARQIGDSNIATFIGQGGGSSPTGTPNYTALGNTHKLVNGQSLAQSLVNLDKKWFTYSRTLIFSAVSSTPNFTLYFGYPGMPTGATHMLVKAHAICGNVDTGNGTTYAIVFVNGVRVMYIGATTTQGDVVADNVMDIVPLWATGFLRVHSLIPTGEVQVEIVGYLTE